MYSCNLFSTSSFILLDHPVNIYFSSGMLRYFISIVIDITGRFLREKC